LVGKVGCSFSLLWMPGRPLLFPSVPSVIVKYKFKFSLWCWRQVVSS
jgi:hypothetical protein